MKEKVKAFFASIGYLLITLLVQVIVSTVGGLSVGIYFAITQMSQINNGAINLDADLSNVIEFTLSLTNIFLLISSILTVLVLILIYKIKKRNYKEEILINRTNKFNIIFAVILGAACWLFNSGALSLIDEAGLFSSQFQYMEDVLSPLNGGSMIISIITIGIVAPFAEEFLFRGIIYNTLKKKVSIRWTIIIQAIMFGVFHGNIIQGSYATLLGIVFGYVTYKTKSLWPAIIMHMVNNLIATMFMYVPSDNISGILVYVVFLIMGIIGVTISLMLIKKKNERDEEIIDFRNINNLN
ncbi:type II CAAX endopeptidase family protein [Clostridium sp. AL.422]|uniref:CPBP family intramembrane glutamic endopeptidase n=1 Tax=Clostridium TaxID=1485 RepID=UPI00293DFA5E|nr:MULTISPECIES: type II CAAX endopeptidase family protein [unclassified Clostridium]MDV4152201.1 type II CAAX endopeptidase family protein [Clostridium sp. AL.422]